jgi:hypothetical protein
MDACEDAAIQKLPAPYQLQVTVSLKDNTITVLDTGIGMTKEQICEAFAPSASFKDGSEIINKRGDKFPYRGYKGVGLTFLAYGTDDVQIHSRQNGTIGRMRFGKQWVDGKRADPPMLDIDTEQTPLDRHKRAHLSDFDFLRTRSPTVSLTLDQVWRFGNRYCGNERRLVEFSLGKNRSPNLRCISLWWVKMD